MQVSSRGSAFAGHPRHKVHEPVNSSYEVLRSADLKLSISLQIGPQSFQLLSSLEKLYFLEAANSGCALGGIFYAQYLREQSGIARGHA
jgi:hypothetical protein